jgi:hypothetical protein
VDGVAVLGTPPTRTISASSAAACSVRAARSGSIRAATVGSAAMTAAANAASARAAIREGDQRIRPVVAVGRGTAAAGDDRRRGG